MFFPTIRWIIISFSVIFIIHNTYLFFLQNMTVPKIQNVSEMQAACYNDIYHIIGTNANNSNNNNSNSNNNNSNSNSNNSNNSNSNNNNNNSNNNSSNSNNSSNNKPDDLSAFLSDLKQRNTIANSNSSTLDNNLLHNNNTYQ